MAIINGTNQDDNDLKGTTSVDIIDGLLGADIMTGLGGNDVYHVDNAGDKVVEAAKGGTDTVISSVNFILGAEIENLTLTGTADFGAGNTLNNVITGNDAANAIDGGAGKDTMSGGKGDDIYYVDNVGDKVVETLNQLAGGGFDTIVSTVTYSIAGLANVERIFLGGTDNLNATGNADNNWVFGNDGNNTLSGGAANDYMEGNGGNDVLYGGTGEDLMVGGAGSDIMYVDDIGDQVHDDVGGGDDTVISTFALTHAFNAEIETYIFKTNADLNFTGNNISEEIHGGSGKDVIDGAGGQSDRLFGGAGNDTLIGADGTDTLDGGTGADTMTGGNGDDYYYVDNVGDKIVETSGLGTGNDWEYSTISIDLLPYQVDNGVLLGTAALHLTGNGTANELFGNNGANTIDGGQGADIMFGGGGNDIFIVDNTNDVAAELLGGAVGGIDLVKSSVGFALGANIENLTLTGTYSTYGTGNALDNTIIGNDVGNELDGGAGKDTMSGGKGDDFYHVDNAGDKVVEAAAGGTQDVVFSTVSASLVKFANVEVLYLDGAADINATGSIRDEELHGNSGKNVLDGGKGADVMKGRDGDDTYYVDNLGDKVSESSGAGTDTMISTIAFANVVANVENYTFNTTTAVHFTGDAGDNVVKGGSGGDIIDGAGGQDTLFGGAGNDTLAGGSLGDLLDGGKGADIMSGGGGNDLYFVDNIADDVQETGLPNAGTDAVFSSVSVDLLWGNVENLQLQGTAALHATGNSLDNIISGNDGGNVLNGGAGIDFLFGHKGNDTLTGGSGSDTFHFNLSGPGNEGHDTITDFVNAEDVLSFIVGDVNNDKVVDIKDLLVGMSVVDHGIGKAVDVHFADGSEITFAGVGTNTITHIEQLVADATTQIHVN